MRRPLRWTLLTSSLMLMLCGICDAQQAQPAATVDSTVATPYGSEYLLHIADGTYRAITADHARAIERDKALLDGANAELVNLRAQIATLTAQIDVYKQLGDIGAKVDKLRADQLTQFSQFALKQQSTLNAVESAVTVPPKSRLQRFAESWQLSFGLKALGAGANARTLFAPPSFGPCPVAR